MTATQFSILETNIDRVGALVELAESHQGELLERIAKLATRPCNGRVIQGVLGEFFIPNQSKLAMAQENKYGITEVVDTLSDAIRFMDRVEDTVSDGVQFLDGMVLLSEFPTLKELYDDFPVFKRELLDLTPEESAEVYTQVAANTGTSPGLIQRKATAALDLAREVYETIDEALSRFKRIKEKALAIAA